MTHPTSTPSRSTGARGLPAERTVSRLVEALLEPAVPGNREERGLQPHHAQEPAR